MNYLATGLVFGYPPYPRIQQFKEFIETHCEIPVIIGTHPIPMKYFSDHVKMSFWRKMGMDKIAPELFKDTNETMTDYN